MIKAKVKEMFEKHIGKVVKVVYRDGEDIGVQKGVLVSENANFLTIRSHVTEYFIAIPEIIKVEVANDG